ncbi:hypothetical protein AGDE_05189 [Angomonas deanei]|nr:hypothetical protein AGDE_05189 [Angomonas deanei]|eukprot:EPY38740.1 hypothetical protein AGDE_05189 [Angomonas deanei]
MKRHEADLSGWSEVDPQSKEQMEILLTFLQTNLTDANAELAYIPSTVDDVRRTLAADGLHKVYVWRAASGEIKDLVSFSIRRAREDTDRCDVAQVVFALFTHKTAVAKAEHCLVIADHLLHASVLYIPALFGFTDSDLVKASLEEVPSCREFLYLTSLEDRVKTVVAPTPASKVYPPVYCV